MKKIMFSVILGCALLGCKKSHGKQEPLATTASNEELAYTRFGQEITAEAVIDANTMAHKYAQLTLGDTIMTSFITTVNSVCQMKGCWMNLEIPGDKEVSVKFKDYGFFVPKDIEGKQVMVEGKAFLKEVSVKDQRHFAADAGKSEQEIAAITESKQELAFLASGVLLKK